jgi:hypothetical protein
VVGPPLQSAEGGSSEAEFPLCRGSAEGSAEGASSEAEIAARRGASAEEALERGGDCSAAGEASDGPYRGVGPWAKCVLEFLVPEEDLGRMLDCISRRFGGSFSPWLGYPKSCTRHKSSKLMVTYYLFQG